MRLTEEIEGDVETLAVILGDQLDERAPLLDRLDPARDAILMMEVADEATHVPSHKQRTALFLSAMRHFAIERQEQGWRVCYARLDAPSNTQTFSGEVQRHCEALRPTRLVLTHPGEWRVRVMVEEWERVCGLPVELLADDHFLASPEEFADWAEGRKTLVLEHFYRAQRKKHGVLLDESGKPEGGAWNFDRDNRETFRSAPKPPPRFAIAPDAVTREVLDLVEERFADAPGRLDSFAWPVTREDALASLSDFVANRLRFFGRYQDAMWTDEPWLYHSVLSPSLNLKLLSVEECLESALEAFSEGAAPIASVEGFVRQLIGWREFVHGIYWSQGADYGQRNSLGHRGQLPDLFWTGDTEMHCLRQCVGEVLENAYGHHIQRLMVIGNFCLTAGVEPRQVADWFLGMYVDGVDWVTTPNTVGMSLHADGGVVGTKPYAASGRYIDRMSNYCKTCAFDPKKRIDGAGARACPFTTLYWDFLIRHLERFRSNRRMALVLKNVEALSAEERSAIRAQAERMCEELGIDGAGLK